MQKQTSIYIPKPCHETWSKMTPTQQGKFCSACSKQVVDFSLMSDNQILNYLSHQTGKVCGRFDPEQLERPLVETKIKKKKSWWMAAFMPLFLVNNRHYGNNNIALFKADTTLQPFEETQVTMGVILEDVSKPVNIRGKVFDEAGISLPGVTIIERGAKNETVTDNTGNFSINTSSNNDSVTITAFYAGYESAEKTVAVNSVDSIHIDMYLSSYTTSGAVAIVVGKVANVSSVSSIDTVTAAIKKLCGISGFKIYPNPAVQNSMVHLEITQAGEYQLQLFDNQSRLIAADDINTTTNKSVSNFILPSNITSGIYYLRLINEQTKKTYTEKLSIQ